MNVGQQASRATRCILGFALSALLAGTAAEAAEPAPAAGGTLDSMVDLVGEVDQAMVDRFNAAVAERPITTVRITSRGGQPVPALQIAEAMFSRGMDVVVRDLCVGPCAHYILVAGRNRDIEEGSLVAFNLSASAIASLGDVLGEDYPEDFRPMLAALHEFGIREQRLYGQRGVSISLLLDPLTALQPHCLVFRRGAAREAQGVSLNRLIYSMWVPTRKQLASAGLEFAGNWPASRKEMTRLAGRFTKTSQQMRFGNDDHLRRTRKGRYSLQNISKCALEEDPSTIAAPEQSTPAPG